MTRAETGTRMQPIDILLVEDNPADADLVKEVLMDTQVASSVAAVGDGVEALEFLRQQGRYADARRPDLILLDLNLPRKDGQEVLEEIKGDPHLRYIPVVVMSMSAAQRDILNSYDRHANCYVTKPLDLDAFVELARSVEDFWLRTAQLPPHAE
jgi:chemotaxis family two-component system response regulator Rcp1